MNKNVVYKKWGVNNLAMFEHRGKKWDSEENI